MDQNYDGNPENQEMNGGTADMKEQAQSAAAGTEQATPSEAAAAGEDTQSGEASTAKSNPYSSNSYQQQYQDNFNYNVQNHTTGYGQGYEDDNAPMSMGEWVLMLLLMAIPCVNIVMCCVWAFGKGGNVNRRNFCRAKLIFFGIGIVCFIIVLAIILVVALGAGRGSYYYY